MLAILGRTTLFGQLDRDALQAVVDRFVTRTFRRGDTIFHQGDYGDTLFVVAEGLVNVYVVAEDGNELLLAQLHPGDSFGELAVIDGGRRTASAQAAESTTTLALLRPDFMGMLRDDPRLFTALLESLGQLLRRMLEQTSDLVFLDLAGRVAKQLLALAEANGRRDGDTWVLQLPLSQTQLAAMVGGSRPSVNQILRSFQDRGYLRVEGRRISIDRPDLLRRRAGA